jgi:hypothetical protein
MAIRRMQTLQQAVLRSPTTKSSAVLYQGIALAFGANEIAHDNVVVSSGISPSGATYACAWLAMCNEGSLRRSNWLKSIQLTHIVVEANNFFLGGTVRTDVALWYTSLIANYVQGTTSLHNGAITLADEQAQWTARKSKLTANGIKVGP